jgi:hypothetical protein
MLDRTYMELLAVEQINSRTAIYSDWLRRRTGIVGLALAGKAREGFRQLSSRGIQVQDPVDFERPVRIDGQQEYARFSIARIDERQTPGAFAFLCEHHTPEFVWRGATTHPNGATGIAALRWLCRDAAAVSAAYASLLDIDADRLAGGWSLVLGTTRLEFVESDEQAGLQQTPDLGDEPARLIAVEFLGSTHSDWQPWPGLDIAWRVVATSK